MSRWLLGLGALAMLGCGHPDGFWCRAAAPEGGGCIYWVMAWCSDGDAPSCDSGSVPAEGSRTEDVAGCAYAPEHENGRCL